ncbi:uncharacterized protein LOC110104406 isoform X2 [Dendrobium catenatum]|uniref:uncharacterized protein LOC110104406 isoform X2 n=1 Tax=Dendrobium catenatum TaxID=906689 RepID=UPI0009F66938|nr:uncharacterized protein LOC110104406 isoform X2 [Dendrobium catenatum]
MTLPKKESIKDKSMGSPSTSGAESRRSHKSMGSNRKSSDENGDGEASPTRAGGSKRCCCDRHDQGYTLEEFMKKQKPYPRDLQVVQKLCQRIGINVPQFSSRECKYRFRFNKLPDKLYTDKNFIEDDIKIEIVLVDASNNVISSGPMATAEIEILVLNGDIHGDENGEWTEEEFKKYVLEPRKGKGPLLIGNLPTRLYDGIGSISDAKFTDNSSWTKSKTFRLGVRGMAKEVQEGISKDFRVLDQHMKRMSTSAHCLAAPIGLDSENNLKETFIMRDGVWSGTNRVDILVEDLLKENVPNNSDIGSLYIEY